MINKQNLWFITLFSLILILGVYYISLPKEALETFSNKNDNTAEAIEVTESDILVALKVEAEEEMLRAMEDARNVLLDEASTVDAKNEAYELLQTLNSQKGKVLEIEKKIKEKFDIDSVVKIEGSKINITLSGKDPGTKMANDIIKEVQSLYEAQMYITVKFQE